MRSLRKSTTMNWGQERCHSFDEQGVVNVHLQLEKAEAKIQELRQTINDMRANHLKEVVRLKEEVNQSLVNPNLVPDSVSYFQDPKLEVDSLYEEIARLTEATFDMKEKHTAAKERMIVYREYAAARTLQATRSKVLLQAAVLKSGYQSVQDFVKILPVALLDETIDKEAIAKVLEQEAEEKVRERLAAKSLGIEVIAQDPAPQSWLEEIQEIAIPEAVHELVKEAVKPLRPVAPKRRTSPRGEPPPKMAGQQETPAPSVSLPSRRENTPVEEQDEEPAAVTPSSETDSECEPSLQILATRTLSPEPAQPQPQPPPAAIKHCVDRGTSPIKELLEPPPVRPSNSSRRVEESKLGTRRAPEPSQTLRQTAPSSARATAAPATPNHPAAAVQPAPQAPAAPLAASMNTALPPAMRPRPPQSEMVTALLARTMDSSRSPRQPQGQRVNSEEPLTASHSLPLKRPNPGPKPPKVLPNIVQLGGASDPIDHEALEEWLRKPESPPAAKSLASPRTTMLQPKIRSVDFPEMPTRLF